MRFRNNWLAKLFATRSDAHAPCVHGMGIYGPNCQICGPELVQRTKADVARIHPF